MQVKEMKALLRKEWSSYIRENIIWLFVLLVIYLLMSSGMWFTVIDPALILYALAVSPVISELKDFNDGWHWYEQMVWSYQQRAMCRYIKAFGYSLAAGFIVLLLSHELLSALSALLIVMAMISLSLPVVLLRHSSVTMTACTLTGSCLLCFPLVLKLSERVRILEISHTYGTMEIPEFLPVIYLLIPFAVILVSVLLTFMNPSD